MNPIHKKRVIASAISLALAAPLASMAAEEEATQDSQQTEQSKEQKVVVTGSRIKRDSFSVTTPLVTLDKEAIEDSGLGSLSEILIENMPGVNASSSNTNTQSSVQNTGLSTINLRDLGTNRTLTLIDGRRVVSNSYSGNYVSLSTIPSGMVDRVEIITGGASAIYGSDAIAGVVNIITQQDKEGFEIDLRGGYTTEGGGEQYSLDFDWGSSFNSGKTYTFFSANYDKDEGISWYDRDRAQLEADLDYNYSLMCNEMYTADGDQCMRDITPDQWRQRSDGTAGGVFEEGLSAANGGYYYDENGLQTGWVEEEYGVNTRIYDLLKIPDEAITAAFKIDHDFDNDVAGYFQLQYSQNNSVNVKSPEDEYENAYVLIFDPVTGEPGRVRPGYISVDNPFVPQEIRDNASGSINWDRRFFEVGNIMTDNKRTTIRSWAGIRGTAFDSAWDWDLSMGYGKFTQKQTRHNELNTVRVAQALDAEYAADGVTIQCADADARAAGCVPLNIFGVGSITPEMADWIRATPTIETNVTQVNLVGYIAGDLFEMPAGAVSSVFGFEYRKDKQELETSEGHRMGGITFNVVPSFVGDLDVTEIFGEINMPLLRNVTGARNLSADLSYRIAEYGHDNSSNVGSYKFGLLWEPVEGYSFRANWANAQRAPSITELESPPRGDFDSFDDICADVTATSTNPGHDACRQDPGIAAAIAANGIFEDENNGYSPNAGNPNLLEETAETFTFGIAMEPIEDLRIAIDYFDISIEDAMEQIPNEEILAQCYASETQAFGADNPYCGFITRNTEGQIIEILQVMDNIAETSTKGYDIALEYRIDLGDYGRLKLKADSTHVDEYVETFFGNDGQVVTEYQGQLWSGIFDDVATASLTWYKDNWRVRWSTRYMSSIVDDHERVEEWEQALADNTAACSSGDASCVSNPETPMALFFPAYLKHNLSVSYNMEFEDDSELRLYGGVRNVFNEVGPFIPYYGIVSETARGNASSEYDSGVGRYIYMGAEYQF